MSTTWGISIQVEEIDRFDFGLDILDLPHI